MPVFEPGSWLNPDTRPEWAKTTAAGRFTVPAEGARFERHFHDDDEFWFIADGKAKILVDGKARYVQQGDIILTRAGDLHDFLEVYADIRGFFLETGHPAEGRVGHLYAEEADGAGHDVPALPLPADFPVR